MCIVRVFGLPAVLVVLLSFSNVCVSLRIIFGGAPVNTVQAVAGSVASGICSVDTAVVLSEQF